MGIWKISFVGFLCVFINLTCKNTSPTRCFKAFTHSAYARKKTDEPERPSISLRNDIVSMSS